MGLDGVSHPPTPRGTDIELPRQPAGFEFCEYCSHAVNYVLHYSGSSEYARMVCAYGVLFGWLGGQFLPLAGGIRTLGGYGFVRFLPVGGGIWTLGALSVG